jgi:hypothetical protein
MCERIYCRGAGPAFRHKLFDEVAPSLSLRSLQGQGEEFVFGCILNLTEVKIPALSQKTRQGRGTLES